MPSSLRRPAVALIATSLAATVLGVAPAANAADGTLSGTVTASETGLGLANAEVEVLKYNTVDMYWETIDDGYATTDADGHYSLLVPQGDYRIRFADYGQGHIDEYFPDVEDVEDATTVTVTGSAPAVVDAELAPGAHLAGTVTAPGGSPLAEMTVRVYREVTRDGETYSRQVGNDYTDENGTYDIAGLRTGDYTVEVSDPAYVGDGVTSWATEWYDDEITEEQSSPLTVTAPATTGGIDVELEADAQFSGTLTDADGAGVQGFVGAYTQVGADWVPVDYAWSDLDGSYVFEGLRAGTYRVELSGRVGDEYAYDYWEDKGDVADATDVELTVADPVEGIDAELVPGEHDPVQLPYFDAAAAPVISGTAQVGSVLTATSGTFVPAPSGIEYSWYRDGEWIEGANAATYTPTAADLGKQLTVQTAASGDGYERTYSEVSAPTAPVAAAPAPPVVVPPVVVPPVVAPPAPTAQAALAAIVQDIDVTGKPKVGSTLKLTGLDKLFRASTPVSYRFQWYAGSKKIKKATKSKLKVLASMKGSKLSVAVTAQAGSSKKSVKIKVGKVR